MSAHTNRLRVDQDGLFTDVEHAVLNGQVVRRHKHDPRGIKYAIEGLAVDGERVVGVVGRFHATDRFLIITVYDVNKFH